MKRLITFTALGLFLTVVSVVSWNWSGGSFVLEGGFMTAEPLGESAK